MILQIYQPKLPYNKTSRSFSASSPVRVMVRSLERIGLIFGTGGVLCLAGVAGWYAGFLSPVPALLVLAAGVLTLGAGRVALVDRRAGRIPGSGERSLVGCAWLIVLLLVAAAFMVIRQWPEAPPQDGSDLYFAIGEAGFQREHIYWRDTKYGLDPRELQALALGEYGAKDAILLRIEGGESFLAFRFETEEQAQAALNRMEDAFSVGFWAFSGASPRDEEVLRQVLEKE